ncbi:PH domain-containing protein [Salinibacillus xinjiangensis]|uniref:PH domain-containing protein n=1 Tax=Salinibacillus xinjiangensis TaxID=1229268 RepID=A0A6G1XBB4_9BACI|nr:PH domain-containing protein [Salinibacillus xinjiangensis]MRG88078.1 PH domain-containing protein [Salinibacillus xinjiangensis]
MSKMKRHHPFQILYDLWELIKNAFFFIFLLFVLQAGSESWWVKYGRIAFLVVFTISMIYIVLKWLTLQYRLTDTAFELTEGVFNKKKQTVPFSKIQHVKRENKLIHRILGVTSITFETTSQGDNSSVKFEVITHKEAERLQKEVFQLKNKEANEEANIKLEEEEFQPNSVEPERTIHFNPTKKEVLKASFTSLSFLAVIPIGASLLSKLEDSFPFEQQADGVISFLLGAWWMIAIAVLSLALLVIGAGILWTYLRYGKYEIASDEGKIYITKGVLEETAFSITKKNVQAIQVNQSLMKRILGLAEVKLVCAGGKEGDQSDVNNLYPFLPIDRAYQLIAELLPTYEISNTMYRLPRKVFWLRILTPSWVWIIATIGLYFWKPDIFGLSEYWWVLSILLLVLITASRILNYTQTRFTINNQYLQFKSGGFSTSMFISKRSKFIEVAASRNIVQQKLGLATLDTVNRANPVLHTSIDDVPIDWANKFFTWYKGRQQDMKTHG